MGAPMQMAAPLGTRARFGGDGGALMGTYFMYFLGPLIGAMVLAGILVAVGAALMDSVAPVGILLFLLAFVIFYVGLVAVPTFFSHKFNEFYWSAVTLDGQPCQYVGKFSDYAKVQFINRLLIGVTFGFYAPWANVKTRNFIYQNVLVSGQPGRLTFVGDPSALLGTQILGAILLMCTLGIYGPWFANNLFAFKWDNSRLDGRPFQFQKDPAGFFGTYLLTNILSSVTCYIYVPWGICNVLKWECERVT
jgi:hypothetical protein